VAHQPSAPENSQTARGAPAESRRLKREIDAGSKHRLLVETTRRSLVAVWPWSDQCSKTNGQSNLVLLGFDAEFTSGPNNGFTPSDGLDYQVKVGGIYRWKDRVKVALIGTILDDHFADANNTLGISFLVTTFGTSRPK
jgi:hypothetical protein